MNSIRNYFKIVEKVRALPAWATWMMWATLGMLVLTLVQKLSDTSQLTDIVSSQGMIRWSVPIMLAGLGGLFAERVGVMNIGLEGIMILGTWFGAWGAVTYGPWAGMLIGILGGAVGGLIHAIATVSFGVDHIISGVAINLTAPGLARYLSSHIFVNHDGGSISQSPRVGKVGDFTFPFLAGGNIGSWQTPDLLGWTADQNWFFISETTALLRGAGSMSIASITAFALVPISMWILWRTRLGLRLRICGEHPLSGESQGINIYRYKYYGVLASGMLAGFGGAFIVTPELSGVYLEGQTQGRGFIGLGALIFGNWKPGGVMTGSLLFGYPFGLSLRDLDGVASRALMLVGVFVLVGVTVWTLKTRRRTDAALAGVLSIVAAVWYLTSQTVPRWWISILPYVIVLLVLVFFSQKLRMPQANGLPYRKGGHSN